MSRLLLFVCACFLAACAETTIVKPDGTVVVNGGVWTKAKGRVMIAKVTMPSGVKVDIRNATEEPDGVSGPQGLIDGAVTMGAARALSDSTKHTSDNDTSLAVTKDNNKTGIANHKLDNAAIPLNGANEVNAITAKKP
jgi:hypothetical protein